MELQENATGSDEISLQTISKSMLLLSGKWKMQIVVFLLQHGSTRFMDLQRGISHISPKILSKALQELQLNDIVFRSESKHSCIAIEYELTAHGKTLRSLLRAIECWGIKHFDHLNRKN
ncbi:winged helix-turn-helix transcriptional regulator [Flavobacterium sp. FlaQc-48]|uniref:winged helix-turn-helix transcriptional regulator n=1 Tax=Flavobacterium sp. FlaQc-48 TaxID=3374181 RepID=UPI0037575E20